MSLFAELKRRNVLRVAAAYVAVAWLVIQVVETIFPAFGFGDAAIRGVVIFLAIGFIPAVLSAWAFELTPDGLLRDSEVDRSSPTIKAMGKRLDRLVIVARAFALEEIVEAHRYMKSNQQIGKLVVLACRAAMASSSSPIRSRTAGRESRSIG